MNQFKKEEVLISVKNVSKYYGDKLILRDIGTEKKPFEIHNVTRPEMMQGQTIAVVGASGSGKSTFFKLLAGIHEVSSGEILVPYTVKPGEYRSVQAGDVGFVQQSYPLSRNQTVQEMLYDGAVQGNVALSERRGLIDNYLKTWGLWDQRRLATCQLSGGQKQRVAIIEQLLCSHHYMLFDEPFSGLDVKNIDDVKKSFNAITTSSEINTIIFSTHDIELAVELSDTIVVLGYERNEKGDKIPGGTIIEVYDLMSMGLAWQGFTSAHNDLAQVIKNLIKKS